MSGSAARLRTALADRYKLARELGPGGMATVYSAPDLRRATEWLRVRYPPVPDRIGRLRFGHGRLLTRPSLHNKVPLLQLGEH